MKRFVRHILGRNRLVLWAVCAFTIALMAVAAATNTTYAQSSTTTEDLKKEAEKGNVSAQVQYAILLEDGKSVPRDYAQAALWYRAAASKGHKMALRQLGMMEINGRGIKKDTSQGFERILLAAKLGDTAAQTLVGNSYLTGQWIKKDALEGYTWLNIAALNNDTVAAEKKRQYRRVVGQKAFKESYRRAVEWEPIPFNQNVRLQAEKSIPIEKFFQKNAVVSKQAARAVLRVCVDETGALIGDPATVTSSGSIAFDEAAANWAKTATYKPKITDGKLGKGCTSFAVKFDGISESTPADKKDLWIAKSIEAGRKELPRDLGKELVIDGVDRDGAEGLVYQYKYKNIDLNSTDPRVIETLKASLPYVPGETVCKDKGASAIVRYGVSLRYRYRDKNDVPIGDAFIDQGFCSTVPGSLVSGSVQKEPRVDSNFPLDSDWYYPAIAKRENVTGKVTLRACLDEHGELVSAPIVIGPVHPLLDMAAVNVAKDYVYFPGTINGKSAPMCLSYRVNFKITEGKSTLLESILGTLLLIAL
jgi:TonB family protein